MLFGICHTRLVRVASCKKLCIVLWMLRTSFSPLWMCIVYVLAGAEKIKMFVFLSLRFFFVWTLFSLHIRAFNDTDLYCVELYAIANCRLPIVNWNFVISSGKIYVALDFRFACVCVHECDCVFMNWMNVLWRRKLFRVMPSHFLSYKPSFD